MTEMAFASERPYLLNMSYIISLGIEYSFETDVCKAIYLLKTFIIIKAREILLISTTEPFNIPPKNNIKYRLQSNTFTQSNTACS